MLGATPNGFGEFMVLLEDDLDAANQLLDNGNAAEALQYVRRVQVALKDARSRSPALLTRLACCLIDCGTDLGELAPIREGLALLESNYTLLAQGIHPCSLEYNLGNAKKSIHDLERASSNEHYNAAAIALLTEAKDHYWQAYKLLDSGRPDPQLLVNLANVLDQCCRVTEALRWYDEALRVAPAFPMALLNRGRALLFLNQMSGSFSIAQLEEARQCFRLAEAARLPPHLIAMAQAHRLSLDSQLKELGQPASRIAAEAEQHERECQEHDTYWRFCLDNFLALNEHALYCRCAGARRDDLAIPPTSGPVGGDFIPRLELLLNRLKSEFCLARALFYQGIRKAPEWDLHPFEGTFSELDDQEAVGLSTEFLRTSFRLCFGVLDRIALGINELYDLTSPGEELHFESFWRPLNQKRARRETRWDRINAQRNRGLVALYSIATDLNRRNGQWGFFKEYRNHLEHGLLIVLAGESGPPEGATPQAIVVKKVSLARFRSQALLMLQLTASAIFSFVFCVREEGRRSVPTGPSVRLEMMKKSIGKE